MKVGGAEGPSVSVALSFSQAQAPAPFLCSFKFLEARGPWPHLSTRPWQMEVLPDIPGAANIHTKKIEEYAGGTAELSRHPFQANETEDKILRNAP